MHGHADQAGRGAGGVRGEGERVVDPMVLDVVGDIAVGARDRDRIMLILRGRRLGFSLAELRELLDLYEDSGGTAGQMVEARRKFQERIAVLERQKVDIEQSLTELRDGIQSIEIALSAEIGQSAN